MRSRFINRYAMELVKKHHSEFTTDYAKNKELIGKIEPNMTKKQVNELAGYVVRILKRMQAAE
jgi:ribosomal protein S17E